MDIWLFTQVANSVCVVRRAVLKHMFLKKVLSSELNMTLDNFFELAAQGNKNNSNVLDEYMDNLALGINNIYTMMDCDIVLGGQLHHILSNMRIVLKNVLLMIIPLILMRII